MASNDPNDLSDLGAKPVVSSPKSQSMDLSDLGGKPVETPAAASAPPSLPNIREGTLPNPILGENLINAPTSFRGLGLPHKIGPGMTREVSQKDFEQGISNAQASTGAIGLAATLPVAPTATIGSLAGSYLTGKGARYGAEKLGAGETGQDIAEAGGNIVGAVAGGYAGSKGLMPLQQWIQASKSTGAQLLQRASMKAGNAPIELSPQTDALIEKITTQSKLGGKMPKVVSDILERLGPSIKQPAEGAPNPLTYDEARILQSNISQLSAEEAQQFKGSLKGLMKQLAGSFSRDVQAGADQAGIGAEHAGGMREYATASARNRVLSKAADYAVKGAIGGGIGYELLRNVGKK